MGNSPTKEKEGKERAGSGRACAPCFGIRCADGRRFSAPDVTVGCSFNWRAAPLGLQRWWCRHVASFAVTRTCQRRRR